MRHTDLYGLVLIVAIVGSACAKNAQETVIPLPTGDINSNSVEGSPAFEKPDASTTSAKESVTEQQMGAPFYPGSIETNSGGSVTRLENAGAGTIAFSSRETSDSAKAVAAFYKQRLGRPTMEIAEGANILLQFARADAQFSVSIETNDDKTLINLARF